MKSHTRDLQNHNKVKRYCRFSVIIDRCLNISHQNILENLGFLKFQGSHFFLNKKMQSNWIVVLLMLCSLQQMKQIFILKLYVIKIVCLQVQTLMVH